MSFSNNVITYIDVHVFVLFQIHGVSTCEVQYANSVVSDQHKRCKLNGNYGDVRRFAVIYSSILMAIMTTS